MIREQISWQKKEEKDFFFEVKEKPVEIGGYKFPEKRVFFRQDDESNLKIPELISVVGKDYYILQNKFINDSIMKTGSFELNQEISSNWKNKSFVMTYFPKIKNFDLGADDTDGKENGARLIPALLFKNSYNGTTQLHGDFGIWRPLCRNMMVFEKQILQTITMRHFEKNEIEKKIQSFLIEVMKDENIIKIKEKIIELKNQEEMNLNLEFLKSLPIKLLYPALIGIKKYAEHNVYIQNQPIRSNNHNIIQRVIKESMEVKNYREIDEERIEYKMQEWEKVLNYNEKVTNNWLLLNMLIKISHKFMKEHQRYNISKLITNQF